ncbi:MAG: type II toxin-antitoxin system PemK/MazF family toxin [Turicibacter sp.]
MNSEDLKKDKIAALKKWGIEKTSLSTNWISNEDTQKKRPISKGAIMICDLGENIGSEQNKKRPVLVVSPNQINKGNNVIVVPLSTKLKTKTNKNGKIVPRYSSHYFLQKQNYLFLEQDSAVKCENIRTVSKVRLGDYLGLVSSEDYQKIENRLKNILDL